MSNAARFGPIQFHRALRAEVAAAQQSRAEAPLSTRRSAAPVRLVRRAGR